MSCYCQNAENVYDFDMEKLDLDTKLWRYLSFDKFIDLITTSELYFASPKEFDDQWECHPPKSLLNPESWRSYLKRNHELIQPEDHERFINTVIANFEANYYDTALLFSCWSMFSDEHAGLWDLYTDKKNAVAISTSFRSLSNSIEEDHSIQSNLLVLPVNYDVDFDDEQFPIEDMFISEFERLSTNTSNLDKLAIPVHTLKRTSYKHEQEIRITFNQNYPGSYTWGKNRIRFDVQAMIQDVIIAPYANDSFSQHISKMVRKKLPNTTLKQSKLAFNKLDSLSAQKILEQRNLRELVFSQKRNREMFYIIFEDIEQFNLWQNKVCEQMGIPSLGTVNHLGQIETKDYTQRWSTPTAHPNDNRILTRATKSIADDMPLYTREQCKEMGWFKEEELV